MKIQSKITLLFLTLTGGILLLLNAFILYFDYQFNYEDFFKRLESRVNLAAQINLYPGEQSRAYLEVRNNYLERLESEQELITKADAKGQIDNADLPREFYQELMKSNRARFQLKNKFFAGKLVTVDGSRYMVVVTALNPYGMRELKKLQQILLFGFAGSLILVFFVGKAFSYYTFLPVRKLTEKVNSIKSTNLHTRLDEPGGKDEIAELTQTFNHMLNRLATAFETQTNFISNASHELRTPLTVISSEVELALNRATVDEESRKALNVIAAQTDKLTQILSSLLLLAQSGYDGKKQQWQQLRIDELIWQAIGQVKNIYPDSQIEVDFKDLPADEQQLTSLGNENLLCLALTNILSNACKYSQNKLVQVKLSYQDQSIVTTISDQGIGIPPTEVQHIFEPFYRASNAQAYQGQGIGLPLALNIIRIHNGSINIQTAVNQGTVLQLFLPVVKDI
ncbi:HAMP domain-containing histidine kinase [Mucilaginibacter sp. Bleaf8]|uniref:HAMP domain-containing sensor histidine kinase n=1 Tax=Mucilaginibacter sp. Bleaf8 TaxID=2834430 RepID=UPI001BD1713E|nr:HAMP domain-containing sensor histidine kinase [Mucilaginibacter sp. Bleaf8]MBS7564423.1 HAMP domain-containing histidine kinase [Mucilaginibacter sp. Bleaf8]